MLASSVWIRLSTDSKTSFVALPWPSKRTAPPSTISPAPTSPRSVSRLAALPRGPTHEQPAHRQRPRDRLQISRQRREGRRRRELPYPPGLDRGAGRPLRLRQVGDQP